MFENLSVGERIKRLRKKAGYNAETVAEKIGVSRATMYRYENNEIKKIPSTVLEPLAALLDTTPEFIMGWSDGETKSSSEPSDAFPLESVVYLPIIGVVRAGVGGIAFEEPLGEEFIETNVLKGHSKSEFFWLKVKGDSMEPRLFDGDLVLVRKQSSIDSGVYAVVIIDDEEGVVKRVTYDENAITLHSQNPAYPPRVFSGKDILKIRIVGQVVRSQSIF